MRAVGYAVGYELVASMSRGGTCPLHSQQARISAALPRVRAHAPFPFSSHPPFLGAVHELPPPRGPPPRAPSPSLLAPCPVCGALFRRGLELDAHVAQEVVAGLSDEDDDEVKETTTRSNREVAPLPPPRVLLPNARAPASTSTSSVFELSDARAEVALFKKSTREAAAEVRIQQQQQENQNRNQQAKRPPLAPAPPKVLRLPRMEQRFNHFADGAGAWGDETLGIDGASGAQAWQARGVSGIGDPFRGASGGAAGE